MAILSDLLAFGAQHSDLIKQIEGLALNELLALLKQIEPSHPLFANIVSSLIREVEKVQGIPNP